MRGDFGPLPGAPVEAKPVNGNHAQKVMDREFLHKPRARKAAAQALALAMQGRYRRLLEATGEDEIVMATGDLAQVMYENVEFTIWALKTVAGLNPPPPEALKPISQHHVPPPAPANDDPRFRKPPPVELEEEKSSVPDWKPPMNCTCPPLEAGIIGRDRHMTSCPLFQP